MALLLGRARREESNPVSWGQKTSHLCAWQQRPPLCSSTCKALTTLLPHPPTLCRSREEQQEVEEALVRMGVLYPECHQHYWIGLRAITWPRFNWLDMLLPNPGAQ